MKKALAALLFCLVPGSAGYPQGTDARLIATPIPIDPADPAHRRFGSLRYIEGWHLTSDRRQFGGYSSLWVDGETVVAISDMGHRLRFRLSSSGSVSQAEFADLPALPAPPSVRGAGDAESLAVGPGGDIWVGFEGQNAVLRYARDFAGLVSAARPPAMRKWSANSGPEGMVRLDGGRFVMFAEGMAVGPSTHAALLFPGDPTNPQNTPFQFGYRPPKGFVPTDAAQLPDGRILVLHRHFAMLEGFAAALAIVDPRQIAPGAVVDGELVAMLRPPLNIDNMEGLSVTREGGRTIVWMISDDNQMPMERTLLLKFELMAGPSK